jgi:hypothetical protein
MDTNLESSEAISLSDEITEESNVSPETGKEKEVNLYNVFEKNEDNLLWP